MKKIKKITSIALIFLLSFSFINVKKILIFADIYNDYPLNINPSSSVNAPAVRSKFNDRNFMIAVNGTRRQEIEQLAFVRNSTLMLPVREMSAAMGLKLSWNNGTRTATVTDGNVQAKAQIGSYYYSVGDMKSVRLRMYAESRNGRAYAPVDFFTELLNMDASVDNTTLNLNYKISNLNPILKATAISSAYGSDLEKKGYTNVSWRVTHVNQEMTSVVFSVTKDKQGSPTTEIFSKVFNLKNGNIMPLNMIIQSKNMNSFRSLVDNEAKSNAVTNYSLGNDANIYFKKSGTNYYLVILSTSPGNGKDILINTKLIKDYLTIQP